MQSNGIIVACILKNKLLINCHKVLIYFYSLPLSAFFDCFLYYDVTKFSLFHLTRRRFYGTFVKSIFFRYLFGLYQTKAGITFITVTVYHETKPTQLEQGLNTKCEKRPFVVYRIEKIVQIIPFLSAFKSVELNLVYYIILLHNKWYDSVFNYYTHYM